MGQPIQHTTFDGSDTLISGRWGVSYHSLHGALTESRHVFIQAGLDLFRRHPRKVRILEAGFGTGLNALLAWLWADQHRIQVHYTALEIDPVPLPLAASLNYPSVMSPHTPDAASNFLQLHEAPWDISAVLSPHYELHKSVCSIETFSAAGCCDLIFFDAFAPAAQPELWTQDVFARMFEALDPGGILVTYCAKGSVKRNMRYAGFEVERLPGPPGKREMTRAGKPGGVHQK